MTTPNDGGPAFPTPHLCTSYGMSLRDWFAGQAVAGMVEDVKVGTLYPEDIAKTAYEIADAMPKAKEAKS
jgi:hypothetical protein